MVINDFRWTIGRFSQGCRRYRTSKLIAEILTGLGLGKQKGFAKVSECHESGIDVEITDVASSFKPFETDKNILI